MAERRQWVKLWTTWYTSASHLGVGAMALHVGAVLMTCVQWSPGDDEAWAELDTGAPLPVEAIAMRCQASARDVAKALAELELRGTVARRDDGAWGFRRFGRWQETPDAARKRRGKSAEIPADSAGKSAKFPREEEAEEEVEAELATQETPPTPSRGVSSETRAEAAFLSHPAPAKGVPAKPRKPRDDYPEGLDRHLLGEIVLACREIGRRGPRVTEPTPGMIDDLRKLWAAERPTADDLTHVVRVRAAMDRAGEGYGELSWEHLCRPASFRRYRDRDQPTSGRSKPWTPSDFGEDDT